MRPIHWIAVIVGVAGAVIGVRAMLTTPPERTAPAVEHSPDADPAQQTGPRKPQIELLGGPATAEAAGDAPISGEVQGDAKSAADRRRERLGEVLGNVQNSPVYVEGVDGPAPESAPVRRPR